MPIEEPLIVVNYKVYAEATGGRALDLTKALGSAWKDAGERGTVIVCPQAADLRWVANHAGGLPCFAQHVDPIVAGSGTGWTLPEAMQEAGAVGTLLNHAEHKMDHDKVGDALTRLRHLGLTVIACAKDADEAAALAKLGPDYVAVEPPELIGGDVSVTSADPDIVTRSVTAVESANPNVRTLCGAGVKTGTDVRMALELGTHGVLLASGVTKAADPRAAMLELLSGLEG